MNPGTAIKRGFGSILAALLVAATAISGAQTTKIYLPTQTFGTLPTALGGTGVTASSTGSGGVVLSTAPSIATPTLTSTGGAVTGGPLSATWVNSVAGGQYEYLETNAAVNFRRSVDGIGAFSAARSSTGSGGPTSASIGFAAFGYNDYVGGTAGTWSYYGTNVRASGVNGFTQGLELDVANLGSLVPIYPSSMFPAGATMGVILAAGGEITNNQNAGINSAALTVISNDAGLHLPVAKWDKGIVFQSTSLNTSCALCLPTGYGIDWFNSSNALTNQIVSTATSSTATSVQNIQLSDFGTLFVDGNGATQFRVINGVATPANYLYASAAATGTGPSLNVEGSDINADLLFTSKGSGVVKANGDQLVTLSASQAITGKTYNKVTITAPASAATLTIANSKTLTASNTLTLTGTDGSTLNVGAGGTLAASATTDTTNAANISSGTLPAGRLPALTGDVTTSVGTVATTIAAGAVTLAKQANLAANSIQGNNTGSPATPLALTTAQTKSLLAIANTDVSGLGTMSTQAASGVAITGGTVAGLTGLGIRNAGTGAFDMTLAHNGTLTAGRTLTLNLNDVARTVSVAGNLTFAGPFSTSGTSTTTLTVSAATNVTLPTTGTLATLAGSEALTNKTLDSTSTLTNPAINGFTGNTAVVNIGSGQFYKDASGNVMLGGTSPGSVGTTIDFGVNGSASSSVSLRVGGALAGYMSSDGVNYMGVNTNGTYPFQVAVNGTGRYKFDNTGNFTGVTAAGGIGYSTGAGGTVTQVTTKATGVTLSKPTGQITTVNAALASGAKVFFTVTNTLVAATDVPICAVAGGGTANAYRVWVSAVAAGSYAVGLENVTAGSLSEAVNINCNLMRGATS